MMCYPMTSRNRRIVSLLFPPLPAPGSTVKRVTVERKAKSKRKMAQQSRKQDRKKK